MTDITFKGTAIKTLGKLPEVGDDAPDFKLVADDMSEITLNNFKGKKIVFNIFPSIDTSVCALQLQTFNDKVAGIANTEALFSSLDLPFAFKRFCSVEGIKNSTTASDFRFRTLGTDYGVVMGSGPLEGLYARAVFILDEQHKIIYRELVKEVTDEPDYDAAMASLT